MRFLLEGFYAFFKINVINTIRDLVVKFLYLSFLMKMSCFFGKSVKEAIKYIYNVCKLQQDATQLKSIMSFN